MRNLSASQKVLCEDSSDYKKVKTRDDSLKNLRLHRCEEPFKHLKLLTVHSRNRFCKKVMKMLKMWTVSQRLLVRSSHKMSTPNSRFFLGRINPKKYVLLDKGAAKRLELCLIMLLFKDQMLR